MNKRDVTQKNIPIFDALNMKCGECLYFKKLPRNGKECCCKQGIRAFASAPSSCFQPDYTQVASEISQFAALAGLLQSFDHKQVKIVLAILANAHKCKNKKFPFGTKVYIKASGRDYLNNYMCAFVMGYTSKDQMVIAGSPTSSTRGKNFIGYVDPDTCLDYTEWQRKKQELISKGHINDYVRAKIHTSVEDYEPEVPTIDSAPKAWTKEKAPKKKRMDVYDQMTKTFTVQG